MKTKKSTIYNLARIAKERMRHNLYASAPEVKQGAISNAECLASLVSRQKEVLKEVKAKTPSTYDEKLYEKVCQMLDKGEVPNPVSYLIDKTLFASLDTEAKQFYINNLTMKYKTLKARYYKEHISKIFG